VIPNINPSLMLLLVGDLLRVIKKLSISAKWTPIPPTIASLFFARTRIEEENVLENRKEMGNYQICLTEVGEDGNVYNRIGLRWISLI
jgi:hypothetical protein